MDKKYSAQSLSSLMNSTATIFICIYIRKREKMKKIEVYPSSICYCVAKWLCQLGCLAEVLNCGTGNSKSKCRGKNKAQVFFSRFVLALFKVVRKWQNHIVEKTCWFRCTSYFYLRLVDRALFIYKDIPCANGESFFLNCLKILTNRFIHFVLSQRYKR